MLKHMKNTILISFLLFLVACENAKPTGVSTPTSISPMATPFQAITTVSPELHPTSRNSTGLAGPYLGQPRPESIPIRFASEIIKGDLHTSPVFTPDGSEVYWSLQKAEIFTMRLENGYWTQPESVTFSESMTDYRDPFISPSGNRLFFLSKGKLPNSQLPENENIWFVERQGNGWGEPQPLGEDVNAFDLHWQISVATNGNLYFSAAELDSIGDIYISKYLEGQYAKPEKLSNPINSEQMETTPYIAPDESYIIFARLKDTRSSPKLYISFADTSGHWGSVNLLDRINYGLCPVVSPDGKYLFFLDSPRSVSWMTTGFIEELRP